MLRVAGWIIASIVALLLATAILLHLPFVQDYLTGKVENYLRGQLQTRISIGGIYFGLPGSLSIRELYMEDQMGDTLVYSRHFSASVSPLALLKKEIDISRIELKGFRGGISRDEEDAAFNFSFIIESFSGEKDPGDKPDGKEETSATEDGWKIKIQGAQIEDLHFSFDDAYGGSHFLVNLGILEVEMDEMDLDRNAYFIRKISLVNSSGSYRMSKVVPDTSTSESSPLEVALGVLDVSGSSFGYRNEVSAQTMEIDIGEFYVQSRTSSLFRQEIHLETLRFNDSRISYLQDSVEVLAKAPPQEEVSKPWIVTASRIAMNGNEIHYDNLAYPAVNKGIDFNRLAISGLTALIKNFELNDADLSGEIARFSFREKSGFSLNQLSTQLSFTGSQFSLGDLLIETGGSRIEGDVDIRYPSLDAISNNLGAVQLSIDIPDASIGVGDALYLAPSLSETPPFKGNEAMAISFNADINGYVGDLDIRRFRLNALSGTSLAVSGAIRGLPNVERAYFDFPRVRATTVSDDLARLGVPDSVVRQFHFPSRVNMIAGFQGTMDEFVSNAALFSTAGELSANVQLKPGRQYSAELSVDSLQLGSIMKNDSVYGPLSLSAQLNGQGFSLDSMSAAVSLVVEEAVFNRYPYRGLSLEGQIDESVFNGHINYQDSSLHFDFEGAVSLNLDTPRYDLTFNLIGADLKGLNLSKNDIAAQGTLEVNLAGSNINNINGDVGVRNVVIVKEGELYRIDSLLFASIVDKRQTNIRIDSDLLTAYFEGTINLGDLPATLRNHFSRYYGLQDTAEPDTLEPQNFKFEIELHNPELLTEALAPGLKRFVPGQIVGAYDSRDQNLSLNILVPELVYNNLKIDTFTFYVDSDPRFLNFGASLSSFSINSLQINNLALVGQVYDNMIETRMQITDQSNEEMYAVGGIFTSMDKRYRFSVDSAGILLNYEEWRAPGDNFVEVSERPPFIYNLNLQRENQLIAIQTRVGEDGDSTLSVAFKDFDLQTLSRIIQGDAAVLAGLVNGQFAVRQDAEELDFKSDISVAGLVLYDVAMGDLSLRAASAPGGRIDAAIALLGEGNDASIAGFYQMGETGALNFNLKFSPLNLAALSGPFEGTVSDVKGFLNGNLSIGGTTAAPVINGSLVFNETSMFVEYLQTGFTLDNQRIRFHDRGITFDDFTIVDSNQNVATVGGNILIRDYSDFSFDLAVDAENFEILNTSKEEGNFYYGRVVVDAEAQITGPMAQPRVQMELAVKKETTLTYSLDEEVPATVEVEGLVEFINRGQESIIERAQAGEDEDAYASGLTGIELTADVLVEKGATLQVIVDPAAGDNLIARANPSSLSLNIDQVGNIDLTGSFEIAEGSYQFSFSVIKREFQIRPGSQITWLGNPMEAELNITAINTVETTPAGILPVGSMDQRAFTDRLPVQVMLHMQNNLMNPDISFELDVAEEEGTSVAAAVRQRLQSLNESDRNKQAFALLILQRFIPDNPLETAAGGDMLGSTARNSVSKILNNQLNNLSQRIKGFNLSFDLESYQTAEGDAQTQLDVTLSRSFFNDRVNVKVGGAIDIEGQSRTAQNRRGLDEYIGDIAVEYKLTPSGNLLLEFFREQTYETFYNELIETGVGIIYVRNYNRFSELLRPNEEEPEIHDEARK